MVKYRLKRVKSKEHDNQLSVIFVYIKQLITLVMSITICSLTPRQNYLYIPILPSGVDYSFILTIRLILHNYLNTHNVVSL